MGTKAAMAVKVGAQGTLVCLYCALLFYSTYYIRALDTCIVTHVLYACVCTYAHTLCTFCMHVTV
jgi:hypothetical protein